MPDEMETPPLVNFVVGKSINRDLYNIIYNENTWVIPEIGSKVGFPHKDPWTFFLVTSVFTQYRKDTVSWVYVFLDRL